MVMASDEITRCFSVDMITRLNHPRKFAIGNGCYIPDYKIGDLWVATHLVTPLAIKEMS